MGRRFSLILSCLVLTASAFAGPTSWTEVHSNHFSVLTQGGEKQGREIALRFEQMRAVFGSLFHKTKVNLPVPLQIIAVKNQSEIKHYSPLYKGKPVELAGFYQGSSDRDFIMLDMSANDPYAVVFHEYAHLLLHGNFPPMPVWFDEGFAEYYSSLRVTNKMVEFGNVAEGSPQTLQSERWMPLAQLFAVQHDSPNYNENNKRSIFYAQSWITVHYLLTNQKLPETARYLQLTQVQKVPIPDAVKQAFGYDIAQLDKNIHAYFSGNEGKYYRTNAPVIDAGDFIAKKVDDITAQAILADLHAHSLDYMNQAEIEFQNILQQDSGNFAAYRGLGYLYMHLGKLDKASEMFRRASALDNNKDAQLHYLNAMLMNREAMKRGGRPDDPAAMQHELEIAIDLDPNMADAYNLLAFAFGSEGKYEPALTAQKKAIELNPSMEVYQANLANIYLNLQRWDEASAVLDRLKDSGDPAIRELASRNLAALQANREMVAAVARQRELRHDDITAPQWRKKGDANSPASDDDSPRIDNRKVLYLYGRLQSVDCSSDPIAILNVRSGSKLMKLRSENYKKLLVMGADEFSCDWRDRKVLVNYKPGGKSDGDIVTLELQAGK